MSDLAKIEKQMMSLVPEERALLADSLLRSLNPQEEDIEKKWVTVAQKRIIEMRSGKVKPVPGEEVFKKIRDSLDK